MKTFSKIFTMGTFLFAFIGSLAMAEEAVMDAQAQAQQEAMMAQIKERTTPGEAHQILAPLAGNWNYTAKFWMAPDAQPEETIGTSNQTLIYGGRFLQQNVGGTWMGEPFEGTGILGYDKIKGEYVNLWFDNMATGVMSITGSYDPATKTLNLSGSNSCPMTGGMRDVRAEYILTDENSNVYNSYMAGPDGTEFKSMEILYTRVSE